MWKENPAFDIFREGAINYSSSFLPLVKGGNHCVHAEHHCEKRREDVKPHAYSQFEKRGGAFYKGERRLSFFKKSRAARIAIWGSVGFLSSEAALL